VGVKQVFDRYVYKERIYNFGDRFGSTLRKFIGFVSQVMLLKQKFSVVEVSSDHVFMKSSSVTTKPINRFPCKCSFPFEECSLCGMAYVNYLHLLRGYNIRKVTGNLRGYQSIRTNGKFSNILLGTIAETRKYSTSMCGIEDNGSALKETDKEEDYLAFIKNDKSLFERAISVQALKKA